MQYVQAVRDPQTLVGRVCDTHSDRLDTDTAIFVNTTQNMQAHDTIAALHPFRGIGRTSDVAGAAVFLASDEAGWITGVSLPVDGGYTAQ